MENGCTSHNSIVLAICVLKISNFDAWRFDELLTRASWDNFLNHPVLYTVTRSYNKD